jgi:ABC-2 type transport system permease protein
MAGLDGAGMNGAAAAGTGPLSVMARRQYAALADMRWEMFRNSLRTNQGVFELGARAVSYIIYALMGLGLSVGLGFGAYAMASSGKVAYLPILFWVVFLIWQLLPVMLASFQEQFDLGILLRFPLGFTSYLLLYLIFGLVDMSTITGGLCSLGLWIGITIARPELSALVALSLAVFAGFNVLLVRAIFAWIDRWLAQRRTREIVGAIFLLLVLSLQLLNPALHQSRRSSSMSRAERAADGRRLAAEAQPWLARANNVQRWLPPGLAAQAIALGGESQTEPALDSLGLLGMYAIAAGVVLALRLRSEYAGENLGEAPTSSKAIRTRAPAIEGRGNATASRSDATVSRADSHRHAGSALMSGPVAAVMEKELRSLLRSLPLLYAVGAPLLLVLVFSGVFIRSGAPGHTFSLALPICLSYAQLGFTQLFYNNLGAEGTGIQLYFLSPTPMRTVMLAKNLFHSVLFALAALSAGVLAVLRLGEPDPAVLAASVAWLVFVLPCNLAAGNIFSLTMAYRVNPGRLSRQRGSQANNLISVLVQLGVIAIGAAVFGLCWALGNQWLAVPIFLVLAAAAVVFWIRGLRNADALASRHKDELIATLAKTG